MLSSEAETQRGAHQLQVVDSGNNQRAGRERGSPIQWNRPQQPPKENHRLQLLFYPLKMNLTHPPKLREHTAMLHKYCSSANKLFKSTTIHSLARSPPSPLSRVAQVVGLCRKGKETVFPAISNHLLQDSGTPHPGGEGGAPSQMHPEEDSSRRTDRRVPQGDVGFTYQGTQSCYCLWAKKGQGSTTPS